MSELRTVWQIRIPVSKELEARDFSRVRLHVMILPQAVIIAKLIYQN